MTAREFTASDIERLLTEARAPTPWRNPSECQGLAEFLNSVRDWREHKPRLDASLEPFLKARAAARTLQRELPHLIAMAREYSETPPALLSIRSAAEMADWQRQESERAARLTLIFAMLHEEFPHGARPPSLGPLEGYQLFARLLYMTYRRIVGSGTHHKNSPAMRFVAMALTEAGYTATGFSAGNRRGLTPAAVAMALERMEAKGGTQNTN